MKMGILSDLHLGHSGGDTWHNRLLFDQAEEVVRETVAVLNKQSLDMVIILGDVTNSGVKEELESAEKVLSKLAMPWLVLPGNHDREGIRTGLFNKTFGKHIPDVYREVAGVPGLFLTEYVPPVEYPKTELGKDTIKEAVEMIRRQNIENLCVFSHFPLISQENYAREHKARYAKHYIDGEELLHHLDKLVSGTIFSFSAHQHWHRIIDEDSFFHCMTASMIEYPMEARIVSMEKNNLSVSTIETACPGIAAMSLDSAEWVRGRKNDRNRRIKR